MIGYWVDTADGECDAYWCKKCAEEQDVPLDRPVDELIIPLPCAWHVHPDTQDREYWACTG